MQIQFTKKMGKAKWKDGVVKFENNKYIVHDDAGDWICSNAKIVGDITDKAVMSFYYVRSEDPDLLNMLNGNVPDENVPENDIVQIVNDVTFDFIVLYSTQLQKKVKSYDDGYLVLNEDSIVLYDNDKKKIRRDTLGQKNIQLGSEFKMCNMYSVYVDRIYTEEQPISIQKPVAVNPITEIIAPKAHIPFKTPYRKNSINKPSNKPISTIQNTPIINKNPPNDDEDVLAILFESPSPDKLPTTTTIKRPHPSTPSTAKRIKSNLPLLSLDQIHISPNTCAKSRQATIPNLFKSSSDYLSSLKSAMYEHIQIASNLQLESHKSPIRVSLKSVNSQFILTSSTTLQPNELLILSHNSQCHPNVLVVIENRIFNKSKSSDCVISAVGPTNLDLLDDLVGTNTLYALVLGFHFDLNILKMMDLTDFESSPICEYLATGTVSDTDALTIDIQSEWEIHFEMLQMTSQLNKQQSDLINSICQSIFNPLCKQPILLCHGYYGCGKSFIIAATILLLTQSFSEDDDLDLKILVSANTNTAVDRVLLILIKMGFIDFIRIGSLSKIHKDVLPFSATPNKQQAQVEINKLLDTCANDQEKSEMNKLLQLVLQKDPTSAIHKCRVVGSTCHSTTLKCMQQMSFNIVFLDEASQMTEPVSLLPLMYQCKRVVMFGDPKQLRPTIETNGQGGLSQSLFERLSCTVDAHCIQTQYRCHSDISKIASKLFYENTVINGRIVGTVIDGIEPVVFVDINTGKEIKNSNREEGEMIIKSILKMKNNGMPLNEIGIITPFKNQVTLLKEMVSDLHMDQLEISTIDAFQGGEKAVIFASLVKHGNIVQSTFMNDERRINVMITRAKSHLILVGNKGALTTTMWKEILKECTEYTGTAFISKLI